MTDKSIPVTLFACNASDDALACDIELPKGDLRGDTTVSTLEAITAARKALETNPTWDCIAIGSDIACQPLDDELNASDLWRTEAEHILVYRFGGLFLRLQHKDNRQAEIEFEVSLPKGLSIPA